MYSILVQVGDEEPTMDAGPTRDYEKALRWLKHAEENWAGHELAPRIWIEAIDVKDEA